MLYTHVANHAGKILVRGYDEYGDRVQSKVDYMPTIWKETSNPDYGYRTIHGDYLRPHTFEDISRARNHVEICEKSNIKVYGLTNWAHTYINETWPDEIVPDRSLIRTVNLDIEVFSPNEFPLPEDAKHPVNLIQLSFRGKKIVIGLGDFKDDGEHGDVQYIKCDSERALLLKFLRIWQKIDPDIVTGWNLTGFDVPYLTNRIEIMIGRPAVWRLSPWNVVYPKEQLLTSGFTANTFEWLGIAVIDYLDAYQKFRLIKRESYRLDYIGHIELKLKKISFEEFSSHAELAEKDHQKFVQYGLRDLEIVDKLDEKLGYIDLVLSLAYFAHCNYVDVFKQTRIWDCLLQNRLMKKNIILPGHERKNKLNKVRGAFVKAPQVGLHGWVASFDLASLYPSSMIALNIGPETIDRSKFRDFTVDDLVEGHVECEYKTHTLAANGHHFRRDVRSFVAETVDDLLKMRKIEKRKMLDCEIRIEELKAQKTKQTAIDEQNRQRATHNTMQSVFKVCANSSYGTIASSSFRLFDVDVAEAITVTGQALVQWAAKDVNAFLNSYFKLREFEDFVVAQDTDSMYVRLDKIARMHPGRELEAIEEFCETLNKVIAVSVKEFERRLNVLESRWVFKMETISDRAIWTGKKRYILNKLVSESGRLNEPEIKITGIEAVRSTTPEVVRDDIRALLKVLMTKEERDVQTFIKKEREKFMSLPTEDIAFPTGCGDLERYEGNSDYGYTKGTPMHIKSAYIYNSVLQDLNLTNKYKQIGSRDKMKFVTLMEPNRFNVQTMAFIDILPPEFELDDFVDKERQFERAFMKPIKRILDAIGWSDKPKRTLKGLRKVR